MENGTDHTDVENRELSQEAKDYLQGFTSLNVHQQIDIFVKMCYNFLKKLHDRIGSSESLGAAVNNYLEKTLGEPHISIIAKYAAKNNEHILANFLSELANFIFPALINFNRAWLILLDFTRNRDLNFGLPFFDDSVLKMSDEPLDFVKMCHQIIIDLPGGPMESGPHDPMRRSYDALVDEMDFIFKHGESIIHQNADDNPSLKIIQNIINRIKLSIFDAITSIHQIHAAVEGYMDCFVDKTSNNDT